MEFTFGHFWILKLGNTFSISERLEDIFPKCSKSSLGWKCDKRAFHGRNPSPSRFLNSFHLEWELCPRRRNQVKRASLPKGKKFLFNIKNWDRVEWNRPLSNVSRNVYSNGKRAFTTFNSPLDTGNDKKGDLALRFPLFIRAAEIFEWRN